jgi:hypothetical protein
VVIVGSIVQAAVDRKPSGEKKSPMRAALHILGISLDDCEMLPVRERLWVPRNRSHVMTTKNGFVEDAGSDTARGAEEQDLHGYSFRSNSYCR